MQVAEVADLGAVADRPARLEGRELSLLAGDVAPDPALAEGEERLDTVVGSGPATASGRRDADEDTANRIECHADPPGCGRTAKRVAKGAAGKVHGPQVVAHRT
jgi:hypothetical protein